MTNVDPFLSRLQERLQSRKDADPTTSYVAGLHARGLDKILEKVGEEAIETVIAAKNGDQAAIIHETADLWFHTLVMLTHLGLSYEQVLAELARRFAVHASSVDS
ncbi:MAG: phosphoribosyl-ATP diphosphatase [Magnetococcales bacterium]|nr:phosphoribosyl-ATP diphosphatase [Magnetococcales bacterium]NGZ06697.1 phosphoribosyl-ATP diphosphatase [Magnetococcales bacterium]